MNFKNKDIFLPLFIGSGRVATHLMRYYSLLGITPSSSEPSDLPAENTGLNSISYMKWNRRTDSVENLKALVPRATHIYLCLPDHAILLFYNSQIIPLLCDRTGSQPLIVHFSGALEYCPGLIAAHPLMTFSKNEFYTLEFYQRIHFVISEKYVLSDVLPHLPNSYSELSAQSRPYYHTLCVLGGNFTMVLIQKMTHDMIKLGIPIEGIQAYVEKVVENSLFQENPLTGPLIRKDDITISRNLKSLEATPYQEIYRAFGQLIYPEYFLKN